MDVYPLSNSENRVLSEQDIFDRFSYKKITGEDITSSNREINIRFSYAELKLIYRLSYAFNEVAREVDHLCPNTEAKFLAFNKLEEAISLAVLSIKKPNT